MTFLNLTMLFALPALALPVLIYFLINRRKLTLPFAAFEWMKRAAKKRRRKKRIDDIMKIAAKTLLVLALILFAARPAFSGGAAGKILVVVDASVSMGAEYDGGRTRLDSARDIVRRVLGEHRGSDVALAVFDGKLRIAAKSLTELSAGAVLDPIRPGADSPAFPALISELLELPDFQTYDAVFFISDFQRSGFQDGRLVADSLARAGTKKFVFLPVETGTGLVNLSLDRFSVAEEGFFPGRANPVSVFVTNHSARSIENLPVTLSVDGVRKDMTLVQLPPGSTVEAHLSLTLPAKKAANVTAEIPYDSLAADNTLKIAANPQSQWNILSVCAKTSGTMYSDDVYVKNALEAVSGGGGAFRFHSVSLSELPAADLGNYDIVMTFGLDFKSGGEMENRLKEYVEKGGSVISFARPEMKNCWAGLGVESEFEVPEKDEKNADRDGIAEWKPDPEKLNEGLLAFMADGRIKSELFTFREAAGIRVKDLPESAVTPRLYLAGIASPVLVRLKRGTGTLTLAGFLPAASFLPAVHNPNFVQFLMRLTADAAPHDSFFTFAGEERRCVPLPPGATAEPGAVFSLRNEKGERFDGRVRANPGGGLLLDISKAFPDGEFLDVYEPGGESALFRLALNPARGDSDLEAADETVFAPAQADGLTFRNVPKELEANGKHELFLLGVLLLLGAVLFDCYAHFLRRRS